jgi:RimK family alpha-L-glutamate ligase
MIRVAIVTDEPGWHGARLRKAFNARGAAVRFLSLRDCALRLDTGSPRIVLPGFADGLPDAVFVRGIAGGSLEEVVFRLDVLHALHEAGIPVYNDARAIERSVDKGLTSFVLARSGLPTPPTLVTADRWRAEAFVREIGAAGRPLVLKPLFGSQGTGLALIRDPAALPDAQAVNGVWYLQAFIESAPSGAADWRLLVAGGQVAAAVKRTSAEWRTNVALGGRCHAAVPDRSAREMAERAASLLGMAYAGVDLMRDRAGRWWVLEVNSIPAWRGLQRACGVDIAALLVDDLLRRRLGAAELASGLAAV